MEPAPTDEATLAEVREWVRARAGFIPTQRTDPGSAPWTTRAAVMMLTQPSVGSGRHRHSAPRTRENCTDEHPSPHPTYSRPPARSVYRPWRVPYVQRMSPVRLTMAVLILASLDLAGTIALKEAALRRSPGLAVAGVALFVALAGALYVALDVADLTIVSLGWIVVLQSAVCVIDAAVYGWRPSVIQVVAIVVAVVALCVAALSSADEPEPTPPPVPPRVPQQRVVGRHMAGPTVHVPSPRRYETLHDRLAESMAEKRRLEGDPTWNSRPGS